MTSQFTFQITRQFCVFFWLFCSFTIAQAQRLVITGTVKDADGEAIVGANVYFLTSFQGGATDASGSFRIETKNKAPYILVVSSVGFETYQDTIYQEGMMEQSIVLSESLLLGKEVVVSASLVEEELMRSTISVQKLGITQLNQMPQANFYDGLSQLKEVDLNTQSMTFKVPNSRGFNSNTNFRFNQIIDGINNQAPGLSFAAGNLFGLPQLDVESVEYLSGASSALYGAGGMNGTLLITSKNPFDYQGFSASLQTGAVNFGGDGAGGPNAYTDLAWRYGKALNERFALKFTGSYLTSQDWVAGDLRDKTALDDPNSTRVSNPGYDGVNVYGDEVALNLGLVAPAVADGFARQSGFVPGQPEYDSLFNNIISVIPEQDVTRTGFKEIDLVNYEVSNLKLSLSGHYKLPGKSEAMVATTYSEGQAVYSAQNRFSISDFQILNVRGEVKNPNYVVRYAYAKEDAGLTYDAGGTAALINESWKPSADWYADYITGFLIAREQLGLSEAQSHQNGRNTADNRDPNGNIINPELPAIPMPGSAEFNALRDSIKVLPLAQGGSRVLDFSSIGQFEGRYNFASLLNGIELIAGVQYQHINADSDGTIFFDQPGNPIRIYRYAAYVQYLDDFVNDRLKLNFSARLDEDNRFDPVFTPRISFVYSAGLKRNHNFRASAQTAFRYPSVADQWVNLQVGGINVVGGQQEVQDVYGLRTTPTYPLIGNNPIFAEPDTLNGTFNIPQFQPETVFALEFGYKAMLKDDKLFLDANIFRNDYDRFQGTQFLYQKPAPGDSVGQRFQTFITTDRNVVNWGWSLAASYQLPKKYLLSGNVAFSTIEKDISESEGFQTNFNTPRYRFNVSLGNRKVLPRVGFNVSYRWQQAFVWESSFGVGEVPAYGTLDLSMTYAVPKFKSEIKIGGANVLNDYYTSSFGSAAIGGLYYIKFTYDQFRF